MTPPSPHAAHSPTPEPEVAQAASDEIYAAGFDQRAWDEGNADDGPASPAGRVVLGVALIVLTLAWTGFAAWSAGRMLGGGGLSFPAIAQWLSIAAGPLALLALAWLIFGRTRRRESERFTRSVTVMRTEVRSLEVLLEVLSQRINDSRSELTSMTQQLMNLGDEATGKLGGITREFDSSAERLALHGEALDKAAESARIDVSVLLDDLPRAEEHARAISETLRESASETAQKTKELEAQLAALSERSREADEVVSGAAERLVAQLNALESAGGAAQARIGEAETSLSASVDALLERTAVSLDEIRGGIDVQSAAVSALVEQASAAIGLAGMESAETLAANVNSAGSALEALAAGIGEQEQASARLVAEIGRAFAELDERFAALAEAGDERAANFTETLARSRSELEALSEQAGAGDGAIAGLGERVDSVRAGIEQLSAIVRAQLTEALDEAGGRADQLVQSARSARPEIAWMRDAALEASQRLEASGAAIAEQQDRLAALLGTLDVGLGDAEGRLVALSTAISGAQAEAAELARETGPALVQAMVQVRETAQLAADRAREAIAAVIPESAEGLSAATRDALERAISDGVEERLREVQAVAARAVESALGATDRLTQQMLALGQSASALERHVEKQLEGRREADSEAFARRVALLMDSMHSAAIDVGKILSDEVDDKAWESYLKGDRGVFTRRASRLIGSSEARAIRAHYETDPEFQRSANRYVHDFEAMLRRVLAERDGGVMAVTLMSSDMGKLYAALAGAIERKR